VFETVPQLAPESATPDAPAAVQLGHVEHRKRRQDGQIADAVQRKCPAGAPGGQDDAADAWSDDAGGVEYRRVQRHGALYVVAWHQVADEGLASGRFEGCKQA